MCRWAVIEPAFWIGQMRTYIGTYIDHLSSIIGFERFRAGQFCIRHYCTVGLDSKEANNEELAEGVTEILPHFALEEGAVAIGEIGCDEQTELEDRYFRLQLELAEELDLPVMIHTPHRDKKRGTNKTFHVCGEHGQDTARTRAKVWLTAAKKNRARGARPAATGHRFQSSRQQMGNVRMVEILQEYGVERIMVDSACDWEMSDRWVWQRPSDSPDWRLKEASL